MSPRCVDGPPGDYLHRLRERVARALLTRDVSKFFVQKLYNSVDDLTLMDSKNLRAAPEGDLIKKECVVPSATGKKHLNQISQSCPRTHERRIARHNAVSRCIKRGLGKQGYSFYEEPIYKTSTGNRKPDLVAISKDVAWVINSQVVGEAVDLKRDNQRNISYYRDNEDMLTQIKKQHKIKNVCYCCNLKPKGMLVGRLF
ncbi:hypothetical protein AVEN_84239-1 [Araneus ventricosus]|uniref:Retrovirus-related Pol polyprotein from type-2 retrotransposable element R2DM n=1 Tax=Araneus ventricosus TaxID=182803 RepID=A0A4Y2L3N8_ARAVE|nr:hypothetical protein AVEN_84239-1 [Araneus ventricosus]